LAINLALRPNLSQSSLSFCGRPRSASKPWLVLFYFYSLSFGNAYGQASDLQDVRLFFFFFTFFRKIFLNMFLTERFQKMDSGLGAIHAGAKVTQLGAVNVGVKTPCHLADDAEMVLT
jgi:hypothetical protein